VCDVRKSCHTFERFYSGCNEHTQWAITDGIVHWFTRCSVPHHSCLALVSNSDRWEIKALGFPLAQNQYISSSKDLLYLTGQVLLASFWGMFLQCTVWQYYKAHMDHARTICFTLAHGAPNDRIKGSSPWLRIDLVKLRLMTRNTVSLAIKHHETGGTCSLVDGTNVTTRRYHCEESKTKRTGIQVLVCRCVWMLSFYFIPYTHSSRIWSLWESIDRVTSCASMPR
jgi:hypothetical protein